MQWMDWKTVLVDVLGGAWIAENLSRTPKGRLTPLELDDMDRSALQLEDELPSGPLVVGGFSQGGIMAQKNCSISMRVRGWRVSWRSGQGASARWIYDCD